MAYLNMFYPSQYVSNEEIVNAKGGVTCIYQLSHTPLLPRSVTGVIYYGDTPLCTFLEKEEGELSFVQINPNRTDSNAISGIVDHTIGIVLTWNENIPAGKSKIVINYEYNLECCVKSNRCPKCGHQWFNDTINELSLQNLANGDGNLDLY